MLKQRPEMCMTKNVCADISLENKHLCLFAFSGRLSGNNKNADL